MLLCSYSDLCQMSSDSWFEAVAEQVTSILNQIRTSAIDGKIHKPLVYLIIFCYSHIIAC